MTLCRTIISTMMWTESNVWFIFLKDCTSIEWTFLITIYWWTIILRIYTTTFNLWGQQFTPTYYCLFINPPRHGSSVHPKRSYVIRKILNRIWYPSTWVPTWLFWVCKNYWEQILHDLTKRLQQQCVC